MSDYRSCRRHVAGHFPGESAHDCSQFSGRPAISKHAVRKPGAMREDLSVVIDASRHAGIANVTFVTEGRLP
jgi:hypothetical protein